MHINAPVQCLSEFLEYENADDEKCKKTIADYILKLTNTGFRKLALINLRKV